MSSLLDTREAQLTARERGAAVQEDGEHIRGFIAIARANLNAAERIRGSELAATRENRELREAAAETVLNWVVGEEQAKAALASKCAGELATWDSTAETRAREGRRL